MFDTPPAHPLLTTPSGAAVTGFTAVGDEALTWWKRLRQAYPETGLWPLLMEYDTPEYLADSYRESTVAESLARAHTLDGAAVLAEAGDRDLRSAAPDRAAAGRGQPAGDWPAQPEQPGFGLPYGWGGQPVEVTVALVPADEPWLVPVVLHYGGWNRYPAPAEHAAIMRYWQGRCGAEPVGLTGTTIEYAVARPPATRADALALAREYRQYNDGAPDLYRAETLTELAAGLRNAPVWRVWWD